MVAVANGPGAAGWFQSGVSIHAKFLNPAVLGQSGREFRLNQTLKLADILKRKKPPS